ncbi:MAG: YegJ family protein [Burkholderiales bacterium]
MLTLAAACDRSAIERAERDEITHMSSEEPAMRKAFEQAQSRLDDFLRLAASPEEGTSDYALKVKISDERNTEYFWVNRFTNEGNVFTGHLNNEPRLVKRLKYGERIQFERSQIVDWTYTDNRTKRMMGNFTACALLTKEPPAQAEAFQQKYGLRCE